MIVGYSPKHDRPIQIGFLGFHKLWDPIWNPITISLAHRYSLDVSSSCSDGHLEPIPEVLFTSVFEAGGLTMQKRWCHSGAIGSASERPLYLDRRYAQSLKIYTSDECVPPPWDECDYAMSYSHEQDHRHLRLPVYVGGLRFLLDLPWIREGRMRFPNLSLSKRHTSNWDQIFALKTRFCNFVYTNAQVPERNDFCCLLSRYKKVDCGGTVLNNIGSLVAEKQPFLENYKFTIAFENRSCPGYVSEKLVDPMIARSVPVYWGSPTLDQDFNPQSIVVATGRKMSDVVGEIIALDKDDSAYIAKMQTPWFHGDVMNRYCSVDYVADFFERILTEQKRSRVMD